MNNPTTKQKLAWLHHLISKVDDFQFRSNLPHYLMVRIAIIQKELAAIEEEIEKESQVQA